MSISPHVGNFTFCLAQSSGGCKVPRLLHLPFAILLTTNQIYYLIIYITSNVAQDERDPNEGDRDGTGSLGYFSCVVLPYCRIGSLYDDDHVLESCSIRRIAQLVIDHPTFIA